MNSPKSTTECWMSTVLTVQLSLKARVWSLSNCRMCSRQSRWRVENSCLKTVCNRGCRLTWVRMRVTRRRCWGRCRMGRWAYRLTSSRNSRSLIIDRELAPMSYSSNQTLLRIAVKLLGKHLLKSLIPETSCSPKSSNYSIYKAKTKSCPSWVAWLPSRVSPNLTNPFSSLSTSCYTSLAWARSPNPKCFKPSTFFSWSATPGSSPLKSSIKSASNWVLKKTNSPIKSPTTNNYKPNSCKKWKQFPSSPNSTSPTSSSSSSTSFNWIKPTWNFLNNSEISTNNSSMLIDLSSKPTPHWMSTKKKALRKRYNWSWESCKLTMNGKCS